MKQDVRSEETCPAPLSTVLVDGMRSFDPHGGEIVYLGRATEQPDGTFQCLAIIYGTLARVEVRIEFLPPASIDLAFANVRQ